MHNLFICFVLYEYVQELCLIGFSQYVVEKKKHLLNSAKNESNEIYVGNI